MGVTCAGSTSAPRPGKTTGTGGVSAGVGRGVGMVGHGHTRALAVGGVSASLWRAVLVPSKVRGGLRACMLVARERFGGVEQDPLPRKDGKQPFLPNR